MKNLSIGLFSIVVVMIIACQNQVNIEKEKAAVQSVVDRFYQLHVTEDLDTLSRIMAHDATMVNFGTDAVEKWIGWKSLKKAFQNQWEAFENPEITFKDQSIFISQTGTVAWYAMQLDFRVTHKGKEVSWTDVRTTGVLEKRNGDWLVVQFHNSVPVLKQLAEYGKSR